MCNPIIDLKALSEPVTKLIEVLAQGMGTLYAPFGTVRQAHADARARIILAKADEAIRSLEERALSRVQYREATRQENIEAIAVCAANELPKEVSNEPVDTDWVLQFMDCAQDICDSKMQTLWARILAGEVSSPGSYSKRTILFLKSLDKWEAEKFSELCSFAFVMPGKDDGWHQLVEARGIREEIYQALGRSAYIEHFASIGMLDPQATSPMSSALTGTNLSYFGNTYVLEGPPETPKGHLPTFDIVSFRNFTLMGNELAKIAGAKPSAGFMERVSGYLKEESKVTLKRVE